MKIDKFGNIIATNNDYLDLIYQGFIDLDRIRCETITPDIELFNHYSTSAIEMYQESTLTVEEFDEIQQSSWYMPQEYIDFDIEQWLISQCSNSEQQNRIFIELSEFKSRNMINLLKWARYFVDTCRSNNVIWGVGRGSSVSSYALYLIGIHKIDSLKYELPITDFFKT